MERGRRTADRQGCLAYGGLRGIPGHASSFAGMGDGLEYQPESAARAVFFSGPEQCAGQRWLDGAGPEPVLRYHHNSGIAAVGSNCLARTALAAVPAIPPRSVPGPAQGLVKLPVTTDLLHETVWIQGDLEYGLHLVAVDVEHGQFERLSG